MMLSKSKQLIGMSQLLQKQVLGFLPPSSFRLESGYPAPLQPRKDLKPMKKKDRSKVYDACWQTTRRTEYKCRSDPEFQMHAFIDSRKSCLEDPCATEMLALDLTHYKPSDMGKRKYPRTWFECVVKRRKRKAHCVPIPPPMPRRKRKSSKALCPVDMCVLGKQELNLIKPCVKPATSCPRFKMPNCCVAARNPPKCRRPFRRCGRRPKTKYPSFSECKRDPFPDARPIECNCLLKPAICDMWRHYRRRFG
ncbi:uncharacterized protein LOC6528263 [Drosophila yakuba]|uniref:Uncharacterized protein n=2 Tax=Drosophila yakuba TaxID=7245 RepID=B4P0V4_DROYA|nr:uncharacterized protein LOC6528263 [Drosophila yakuba]EDW89028.2 uncharacterized protein Dyak_GE19047 [Drosophila yakuba]